MCSNRSIALRGTSPTMQKPEIFPTEESIQSTASFTAQKWKLWCLKFREESSTTMKRWAYLALHGVILSQAQAADAVNFFPLQTLPCLVVAKWFFFFFLAIPYYFPSLPSRQNSGITNTSAVTRLIKYEQYQLGVLHSANSVMAAQGASLVEQGGLYDICP